MGTSRTSVLCDIHTRTRSQKRALEGGVERILLSCSFSPVGAFERVAVECEKMRVGHSMSAVGQDVTGTRAVSTTLV